MITWFIVAGAVALLMSFVAGQVQRMPLSTAIIYLGVGYALGPNLTGLLKLDPRTHSHIIEGVTEVVIVVSIFSGALKMRLPVFDKRWLNSLRLVSISLVLTVAGIMALGYFGFGLPIGAALLLGAILAPTDPVLASDVQVEQPFHPNRLRFALTGEAGMNDGAALPLVTLGLALVGVDSAHSGWSWIVWDVIWGITGAVAIGGLLGHFAAQYMLHLRLAHDEKLGTDNFLALGLMGLSYGVASAAHTIGFVAVFAAGVAVREIERHMDDEPPKTIEMKVGASTAKQDAATDPNQAGIFMLLRLQSFTGSLERVGEAAVVILLGSLLQNPMFTGGALIFGPLLFFVIRPVSVFLGLLGSGMSWAEQSIAGFFGIRGMASVYYVAYVYRKGVPASLVQQLGAIVFGVVAYSILLHGTSATPVMRWFEKRSNK